MTKIQQKNSTKSSMLPYLLISVAELIIVVGLATSYPENEADLVGWLMVLGYISMPAIAGILITNSYKTHIALKYIGILILVLHVGLLVFSQI